MKELLSRIKAASLIICLVLAAGVALCPFEARSGGLPKVRILADAAPLGSLPRVDIIYGHGSGSRDLVDAAVRAGARGIIIAGAGNGGIFPSEKEALIESAKKGIVVVRASRTGSGIVTRSEEYNQYGFVSSGDLNPQKARILLMLALTWTSSPAEVQRIFDEY